MPGKPGKRGKRGELTRSQHDGDLSLFSGEFTDRVLERCYRQSQVDSESRQIGWMWLSALVFFFSYGFIEHFFLPVSTASSWQPRAMILVIGVLAVALCRLAPVRQYRDLVSFVGLLLVSLCYALLLAERQLPGNTLGALPLLVVGMYLFTPGRFWLVCSNGLFASLVAGAALFALDAPSAGSWLSFSYLLPANLLAALALASLNRSRRGAWQQRARLVREVASRRRAQQALALAHRRSRALLYNTLPDYIVEALQQRPGQLPARSHSRVTVLFADLVGFTRVSRERSPRELLALLNDLFTRFDGLARQYRLEKIKTMGDSYLAVAGVGHSRAEQGEQALHMSLALREAAQAVGVAHGVCLRLRIGVHSGPVIAGVIGRQRFAFDIWGETVNIASRLQGAAEAGGILVSSDSRALCRGQFLFGRNRALVLRGCGAVHCSPLYGCLASTASLGETTGDKPRRGFS
jgi:class 3 adenylate cyclase